MSVKSSACGKLVLVAEIKDQDLAEVNGSSAAVVTIRGGHSRLHDVVAELSKALQVRMNAFKNFALGYGSKNNLINLLRT